MGPTAKVTGGAYENGAGRARAVFVGAGEAALIFYHGAHEGAMNDHVPIVLIGAVEGVT